CCAALRDDRGLEFVHRPSSRTLLAEPDRWDSFVVREAAAIDMPRPRLGLDRRILLRPAWSSAGPARERSWFQPAHPDPWWLARTRGPVNPSRPPCGASPA